MSVALDRRHKWGQPEKVGLMYRWTCSACGRTEEQEGYLVPDQFIRELVYSTHPNPLRQALRARG